MDESRQGRLRQLLVARVLGAEVDLQYRVLALTVEPEVGLPSAGDAEDPRLQVLFHPVGTVAASLVRHDPDQSPGRTVMTFDVAQLPDVVAALDGPVPIGDPLPDQLPDLHAMEGRLSLRGMAQVAEGHRHPLALSLVSEDLTLDLWATFDDVELRDPTGQVLVDW